MAFHPDITRKDTVSLALDTANAAVRIASKQLTGNVGTVEIPNADGTSTIMGVGAGETGIAPWVGNTTAPGKPLGITAESHNGAVWVSWDGTLDGGVPPYFDHVQFTAVDGSQTVDMGQLKAAGKVTAAELTAGDTVTITAIAYDDAHAADGSSTPNASVASDPVTVVVQSAVDASVVKKAQDNAQSALDKAGQATSVAQSAQKNGVTSYVPQYAQTADPTTAPKTGWSETAPAWVAGRYIWVRTIVTYGSGDHTTTDPVVITGNTGATGAKGDPGARGADGAPGKNGIGVTSTTVTYQPGTSGTTAPAGSWSVSVPAVTPGDWLWTRTVWQYTDGTSETAYSTAHIGRDGNSGTDGVPGKDGVGIRSSVISYASSPSGTSAPSDGWQATPPNASAGMYVWTRTVFTYTDGMNETAYSVGKIGDTGATGAAGSDGVSVSAITPYWAMGTSAPATPTVATPPSPWVPSEPAYARNQNLYTTRKVTYSNGQVSYTPVVLDSSYQYAAAAETAAQVAQTTADGKNKIFSAASEPAHTGLVPGDLWFQLNSSKHVTGIQVWNGSAFVDYRVVANEILVAGSVGTVQIANGAVTADQIGASAVTAINIAAQTITGDKLDVGSVAAAIVTSGKFQSSTAANTGIKIDSTALRMWDSAHNQTVYLDGEGKNNVLTGSFQTAVTGNRVKIDSQSTVTIIGSSTSLSGQSIVFKDDDLARSPQIGGFFTNSDLGDAPRIALLSGWKTDHDPAATLYLQSCPRSKGATGSGITSRALMTANTDYLEPDSTKTSYATIDLQGIGGSGAYANLEAHAHAGSQAKIWATASRDDDITTVGIGADAFTQSLYLGGKLGGITNQKTFQTSNWKFHSGTLGAGATLNPVTVGLQPAKYGVYHAVANADCAWGSLFVHVCNTGSASQYQVMGFNAGNAAFNGDVWVDAIAWLT